MPAALPLLEAVDLAALCAVLLLIGLGVAVGYTFTRLADVLDVSIGGFHPFGGIADAIRSTIVAGCNAGVSDLQHVARDLWHWSQWSIAEMVSGLHDFVGAVDRSLAWLRDQHVWAVAHALVDPVGAVAHEAKLLAVNLYAQVQGEAFARARAVERSAAATLQAARRDMAGLKTTILGEPLRAFATVESDVQARIDAAVGTLTHEGVAAANAAAAAAATAAGEAETLAGSTAGEIRDLLGKLNPADVASLLAAVPLVVTAVKVLEAETGLGNADCRSKVKGICATPPSAWLHLIEGLALGVALTDIHELIALFEEGARVVVGEVEGMFR